MSVVSATALRLDDTIDRLRSELGLEMQGLRDEMSEIRTELRAFRRQQQRTDVVWGSFLAGALAQQ
jgi:hypothetical protein